MGQSNSRASPAPEPSTNETVPTAVAGASGDVFQGSTEEDRDAPRSRRSSVRKNLLSLVKPSNIRSRVNSVASTPGDLRRSWRNSRRWSKSPMVAAEDPTSPSADPLPSSVAGPSGLDKGKQRARSLSGEVEEAEFPSLSEEQPSATPVTIPDIVLHRPSTVVEEIQPVADKGVDHEGAVCDPNSTAAAETMADAPPAPSATTEEPASAAIPPSPAPPPAPRPHTIPLPPRQFPPPGTLVVVQGIVHTTDVSRAIPLQPETNPTAAPSGASLEDPSPSRPRNRLSALLRPRSTSSRPSSVPPSATATPPPETESPQLSSSESQSSSDESAQTTLTTPPATEFSQDPPPQHTPLPEPPPSEHDNRLPSISSSSIDVLGTLLSVAAAATAASLLTGSSEPILSSGLAPPSSASSSSPSTASLHPHPRIIPPDISAAGRAERMRQAWGTIRERLGLRPSATTVAPANPTSPGENPNPADANPLPADGATPAPTDTRELMLAEMARAFNIGLGLNGLGTNTTTTAGGEGDGEAVGRDANGGAHEGAEGAAGQDDPPPHMPPEGSFERFLVDLQIDLRAALTQVEDSAAEDPPRGPEQPDPPPTRPATDLPLPFVLSSSPAPTVQPQVSSDVDTPRQASSHEENTLPALAAATPGHSTLSQERHEVVDDVESDSESMPFLQELTDSDSEFDEEDEYNDDDFHSAQGHEHEHSDEQPDRPMMSGTGRIDASGRINWWRLYRFPPIVSPRADMGAGLRQAFAQGVANATSTPPADNLSSTAASEVPENSTAGPSGVPSTVESSSSPDIPPSSDSATATPSSSSLDSNTTITPMPTLTSSTPVAQLPLHAIVPVIVVGLQSVNSEWRPDMPTQGGDNDGIDFFGQPGDGASGGGMAMGGGGGGTGGGSEMGDDEDLDPWVAGVPADGTRERERGRGWQSRAANAIRNLRPGRRNAEPGAAISAQAPSAAPGSRTFLIYVIGGYYPPDHSIVTGGPNNLDSFEALLELADLLGQVKPPTVSKDEIAKSGLEIIKASQLPQHEKDGKVSSNCLDRCLICLDDYEPSEDIRVMSCRHAFHKGCVDEWLQRGRNNCPACRSTGVSNDAHGTSMPVPAL